MSHREKLQMPARCEADGPIVVKRIGDSIIIEATQGALSTRVEMSEYNAWRAFGCLALLLKIELPLRIAQAISLSGPGGALPKARFGHPEAKLERARLVETDDE